MRIKEKLLLLPIPFCLLIIAPGATVTSAESPKSELGVEFVITAADFVRNLQSARPTVEKNMSDRLAELGNQQFGFLRWQSVYGRTDRNNLPAVLTISLEGRAGGMAQTIWLTFGGTTTGDSFDCGRRMRVKTTSYDLTDMDEIMYQDTAPQPSGNQRVLERNLDTRFEGLFKSDTFRTNLEKLFLSKIPIGHSADLVGRIVVLPFKEQELRAEPESVLKLSKCSSLPTRGKGLSSLLLRKTDAKITGPEWAELVQTTVSEYEFAGDRYSEWRDEISAILRQKDPESLDVFMKEYHRSNKCTEGKKVVCL